MPLIISKYISIANDRVKVNGKDVFAYEEGEGYKKFIRTAYRHFKTSYAKFFKMDTLSKLGFMAVDILLKDTNIADKYPPERIGLVLTNGSSSLEVDEKHMDSIRDRENYFPSPSNFVYTLPNIMAGEAAIKHTFRGENTVMVCKGFEAGLIFDITKLSFETDSLDCCICGWVEQYKNNYESILFLVERSDMYINELSAEDVIFEPLILEQTYKHEI